MAQLNFTTLSGLTIPLSVDQGGTGATTVDGARTGLGFALPNFTRITTTTTWMVPLGVTQVFAEIFGSGGGGGGAGGGGGTGGGGTTVQQPTWIAQWICQKSMDSGGNLSGDELWQTKSYYALQAIPNVTNPILLALVQTRAEDSTGSGSATIARSRGSITSITYQGINLSPVRADDWWSSDYNLFRTEIWYLINPPVNVTNPGGVIKWGTGSDTIAGPGSACYGQVLFQIYSNTNQTNPINTHGGTSGYYAGQSFSTTLTTSAPAIVVDTVMTRSDGNNTWIPGTGQNEVYDLVSSGGLTDAIASSWKWLPTAQTTTNSWSRDVANGPVNDASFSAVALNAASSTGRKLFGGSGGSGNDGTYLCKLFTGLTPGNTWTITIGAGGTGGAGGASTTDGQDGGFGGTTKIVDGTTTRLAVMGGIGGTGGLRYVDEATSGTTVYHPNFYGTWPREYRPHAYSSDTLTYATEMTGANENPVSEGGKWTAGSAYINGASGNGNIRLVSGEFVTTTTTDSLAVLKQSISGDQYALARFGNTATFLVGTGSRAPRVLLCVQGTSGQLQGYECAASSVDQGYTSRIAKRASNGVFYTLATETSTAWQPGDILEGRLVGSTVSLLRNGSPILSVTDTSFTSGYPGWLTYESTTTPRANINYWAAGPYSNTSETVIHGAGYYGGSGVLGTEGTNGAPGSSAPFNGTVILWYYP